MRKCRKAYGRRDWRRRGGIYRGMKRVNKSIRRCDERRRKRWRRPRHELYEELDTKEGEKTLYRLARHQAGKDVQQVRMMKDKDGNVMTDEESVLRIWKEYYMGLMNGENERERRENDGERVNLEVESISKEEVRENIQRMKNGKAVGPDDIPVEVWKCLGESALKFLTKLYNRTMESERMPEEWRDSVLIPIFKNKGDVQSCSNYRGIKLIGHQSRGQFRSGIGFSC